MLSFGLWFQISNPPFVYERLEGDTRSNTENDNPDGDSDWLHTNDSYQRQTGQVHSQGQEYLVFVYKHLTCILFNTCYIFLSLDCPCINSSNRDAHKENIPWPAHKDPKERKAI